MTSTDWLQLALAAVLIVLVLVLAPIRKRLAKEAVDLENASLYRTADYSTMRRDLKKLKAGKS